MTRRLPLALAGLLAVAASVALAATPIVAGLAAIPFD
jgi:hypothetical protein